MHRYRISLTAGCALLCVLLLGACHSVPKHARYIPKDASVVLGLNTGAISKKVAWSVITGSKLLDDIKAETNDPKAKSALEDISHCGIDWMSTVYLYLKSDRRFQMGNRMTLVAPLDKAQEWEAYLRKSYPQAVIKKVKDRSEAQLGDNAYAAWTGDILLIMNAAQQDVQHQDTAITAVDTAVAAATGDTTVVMPAPETAEAYTWTEKQADPATTAAEMDLAFALPKESSILDNDRFTKLEKEGHHISLFISYDALMSSNTLKDPTGGMMTMMLNGSLWKNAVMATGVDFEDGRVVADMLYYPSDSMRSMAREAGKQNVDGDLLGRLPADQLNMAMGYHLSPDAVRMLLDKMGLSGMINLFLMQKSTNVDDILGAFTGDMGFTVNGFSMSTETVTPDSLQAAMGVTPYEHSKSKVTMVFAMKLKDKAKFDRLLTLLNGETGLQPVAPNTYIIPIGSSDSVTILTGEHYMVASNRTAAAQAFLQGKGSETPELVKKHVSGHPAGMVVDIRSLVAGAQQSVHGRKDSMAVAEVRNLFSTASMSGGEFKGDANVYHMELNFTNKEENSLLQLLHMAQRLARLKNEEAVATR